MSELYSPLDQYNKTLLKNIFPSNWQNPSPEGIYDLVVIGAGPGGMTAAMTAKQLGAKRIALIESNHLGGECLSSGCIPSKAFIKSSRVAHEVRHADQFGIDIPEGWKVDFDSVMQRVRALRSEISFHDALTYMQKLGIDPFFGFGKFTSPDTIEVQGAQLRFKKAIIATGTQPVKLDVPGLEQAGYLTNQTIFNLTKLPNRLAVIGGGPIGCELAQAFARFGSKVHLISNSAKILPREEELASDTLTQVFVEEGINLHLHCKLTRVENNKGTKVLFCEGNNQGIEVDEILVAVGRVPAINGLGLESAKINFDMREGIKSNERMETTNPNVYSVGDVSSKYKFTHISRELGKMAAQNIFNHGHFKKTDLVIPWCTFTQPEIAHVGLYEKEAREQGLATRSVKFDLKDNERAILDGETKGFVEILVKEDGDTILGATLVANHAGEMLSELTLAIAAGISLPTFAQTIHTFPTQSDIIRRAALIALQTPTAIHA